jgi:cation transport regulator ChaC
MGTIGILAYGSLIANPGPEIGPAIIDRIKCKTPFKVEFARASRQRAGAPTLVPYEAGGQVLSELLIVDLCLTEAMNRLYRREINDFSVEKTYVPTAKATNNTVLVETIEDFEGVDKVLYTRIGANIGDLTSEKLAALAIASATALGDGRDGITYLNRAMEAGIETPLTGSYTADILRLTGGRDLADALAIARSK